MSPLRRAFFALCATAALAAVFLGGARAARAEDGEALRVFVLTMGPGDHPFFKFGHNAIAIEAPDRAQVYNFGTFNFETPNLIPKFLRGRLKYWLSSASLSNTLLDYTEANRSVYAQELDLTPAQKAAIKRNLDENLRPENREYLYDYFWDNCSTRVRDAVDVVVGGRVRAVGAQPGTQTFRQHALRMTSDFFWVFLGLDVGLGSTTDVPLDRWREAFLPQKLRELLRDVRVPAEGGGEKPLVKEERTIFEANRPAPAARPPARTIPFLLVGLAQAATLFALGRAARARRPARVALAVASSLLGFLLGLLGLVLVGLWAFTNHRAAHANVNILLFAPFTIVLVGLGVGLARGRARATELAYWLALSAAISAAIAAALLLLPKQDDGALVALFLPLWIGLAAGLAQLRRTPSSASSSRA